MSADRLRGLRLAIIAPIGVALPPNGYGPWEQIASSVADGMFRRGLDVTVFASGDSQSLAKVASIVPLALAEDPNRNGDVAVALHIAHCFERAKDFDLIHNHLDWKPLTYALCTASPPLLTTVHGFCSPHILDAYYAGSRRSFFCSISDADRDPGLAYLSTVYNGIDPSAFPFSANGGDYLLFLGRFHPEKGAHHAIAIAQRSGVPLVLAGIAQDEAYFAEQIAPHIDGSHIRFVGPVAGAERNNLLAGARALIHMVTRPERFGLVMVEAMACGTPVIGARLGSVPEIVADGRTGYVCTSVDEGVDAVRELAHIERLACRAHVENHFSAEIMIDGYVDAYCEALRLGRPPAPSDALVRARKHDHHDRPMAFTDLPPRARSSLW